MAINLVVNLCDMRGSGSAQPLYADVDDHIEIAYGGRHDLSGAHTPEEVGYGCRRQSNKRKAAEAALASIYSTPTRRKSSPSPSAETRTDDCQNGLNLPSCTDSCKCRRQSSKDSSVSSSWCGFGVTLPHINWKSVIESSSALPFLDSETGNLLLNMEEGVKVIVVETAGGLASGLDALKQSMQDPVIAIDLEWKPDRWQGSQNKVAMLQLASNNVALLIRTCNLGYKLMPVLDKFLRDPKIVVVGFSWDSADEKKCLKTFSIGRQIMATFLDLQAVGGMLGYKHVGLGTLSQKVLGVPLPKSKSVTMSNWEASSLNPNQLVYAALDALVTGAVFRALRLWHSMPSDCSGCRVPLGVLVQSSGRRKLKRSNSNTACKAKVKADRASVCCTKEGSDKCWSCGRQTTE